MKSVLLACLALFPLAACDAAPDGAGIPGALQGRWGLVAADCDPARDDAKGLMVVGPQTLAFYESRAELGEVAARGAASITAEFAFSGEGQTWRKQITLASADGGATLHRKDGGAGPEALDVTYRKCP